MNMVEITAVITAFLCVAYAVFDGLSPLAAEAPKFFRSRSRLTRLPR